MAFAQDFEVLTGNAPFPWQSALHDCFAGARFPAACDLPTGLGKTSVMAIWLLALARNPTLPRRLVYVVNRRTVVDQATAEAERMTKRLLAPEAAHLRSALDRMSAARAEQPLVISTLRGEFADNGAWRRDPARPAIVVGTVDMIGSRLLFSGYGCGFRSRPLHAGFLGQDALLVHDEAHLEPAFQALLSALAEEQRRSGEPRPLRVLALSATGRTAPDFSLGADDLQREEVVRRLRARKGLRIHAVATRNDLPDRVAAEAARLSGKVIVFLSAVEHVEKCAQALRKLKDRSIAVLTGTMRGAERDRLVSNPVFARFLPRPDPQVQLQAGTVCLIATAAGEVGIDLSADHLVTDLPPFDALVQRLGRVNRYGEGDAQVHVVCEALKLHEAPSRADETEGDGPRPAGRREEYERARGLTLALLGQLPPRADGSLDASPAAFRGLPLQARQNASTPEPEILPVDALLFDRWSYTAVHGSLPGRPPVTEWLHGRAEWEPPRTSVAWRSEVAWLTGEHLGQETLDDLLADYPLRSRETLSDVTARVSRHLARVAERDRDGLQRAWLLHPDRPAEMLRLADLVRSYDPKRNPSLEGATVVLAPAAGGLQGEGLLDGAAAFDPVVPYDLGPRDGERVVLEVPGQVSPPAGMRLVRAVRRTLDDADEPAWWQLHAKPRAADDDGSRSSRTELLLDVHLRRTEAWASRLAERLALDPLQRQAFAVAARVHDLGKRRQVWQRSIKRYIEPPLAKGPMQPAELGHYRHELGSLHDGDFGALDPDGRDLALHVVAAHHGRARPHFPAHECYDPELPTDVVSALVREVPLRFDRLQTRYGRWGLAWLESILRAADVLGSEDEEAEE